VAPAVMKFLAIERLQPVCLHTLGKQKAEAALDDALRLLQSSPKELVRMRAAQALGRIGSPKAIPALIAALEDSLWDVRRQAEDALLALGKPSVEPLQDALVKLSPRALPHAVETLKKLDVPAPERWLASDDWAVRGFAAATLTDVARLRMLRKTEKHPFVLSRINEALERLQAAKP